MRLPWLVGVVCCVAAAFRCASGEEVSGVAGISFSPGDAFHVDGDLSDWREVPKPISLCTRDQVVWGADAWADPGDLSAGIRLAWSEKSLFLAVDVTDDILRQTQRGGGIWKGDHIELFLDLYPGLEPERDVFGLGQFQLGFSPGSLERTGDPLVDIRPGAYCFRPAGVSLNGVAVAACRTSHGWALEASVPWTALEFDAPAAGAAINYEVAVSDTDTLEPQQESMMTSSSAPWAHRRSRLVAAALAGADGVVRSRPQARQTLSSSNSSAAPTAGPPEGPLPFLEPEVNTQVEYHVEAQPGGRLQIAVGDTGFLVESRFSTPAGKWERESCAYFHQERLVTATPEALLVKDTLTNLTDENLPLMHRHEIEPVGDFERVWLSGLEQFGRIGSTSEPANPTTYASIGECGIGLVALDDVLRLHVTNYALEQEVDKGGGLVIAGMADNDLVLSAGAAYTAEWAIIPTDKVDYWRFINAARRVVDANFTIQGGFAFLRASPTTDAWRDQALTDFITYKDARYVCASINYPQYNGHYAHGTSFQRVNHDNYRTAFERWRRLVPGTECLLYFHCFLDVVEDGPVLFADSRMLRPDGSQAAYSEAYDRLYVPSDVNAFGTAVAKNVDIMLDEIGGDGVYWDEHEYSRWRYHYGVPWDGFSGDVDPKSMMVKRLKSSVTLLSEPWRVNLAQRILERGILIGNGPPLTKAMSALHFPCFVETGSITNCARAHLYTPIALGDHLTERSEEDAYKVMLKALDYGCVYYWYGDVTVIPTHHHLTQYMYPITPVELHEGYIIGEERIITNRSGMFGWGDNSSHEVHVFDDTGHEAPDFAAPLILWNCKTCTELRIPKGWSAAIVRIPYYPEEAPAASEESLDDDAYEEDAGDGAF